MKLKATLTLARDLSTEAVLPPHQWGTPLARTLRELDDFIKANIGSTDGFKAELDEDDGMFRISWKRTLYCMSLPGSLDCVSTVDVNCRRDFQMFTEGKGGATVRPEFWAEIEAFVSKGFAADNAAVIETLIRPITQIEKSK